MLAACATTATTSTPFPEGAIEVGGSRLEVWVADDTDERRQGLRGVEGLPDGLDGMLFAYQEPVSASFTMRDTLIQLDIWWFDASMTLVGTGEMEPCRAEPCTSYGSPGPVQWVLETPAGEHRFEPGDRLSIVESG